MDTIYMVNSPIHIVIWAGKWEVVSSHRGAINYNEYIYIYILTSKTRTAYDINIMPCVLYYKLLFIATGSSGRLGCGSCHAHCMYPGTTFL